MKRMFYLLVTVILIAGVNVTAQQENSEQKSPKVQSLSISPKFSIAPKTLSTPYYNFVFSNVRWIGDINGDGKTEIAKSMYTGDERTESDISDLCWKTAFFSSSPVNEPSHIYYDRNFLGIGDFNNDGIDDVFDVVTSSVFIGSNTGLNPVGAQMTNFRGTENIIPLNDVNGDGFADFFSFNNDSCQYALGNNEPFREFIRLPDYNALGSIKVYPFDFDKDGEAELFIMPDASETVTMCYILKYENDDFILADSVDFAIHFNISLSGFCDINGDKLPDFWYPVQDASTKLYDLEVRFGISAAPYFSTDKKLIKTQASTNKFIYSGDINQDGYDDVVATDLKVPPTIFLGKADVINGFTVRAINVPPFIITWPTEQSILGDENGDSYPDMMYNYYQLDLNTGRVINIGFGILQGGEIISEANNRALSQDFEEAGMTLRYGMISDNLGDVNGDGYEDFGITSFDNIYADVFFGGKNINTAADTKIELSQHTGAILYSIDGGDINGDGLSDIIVSNIEPDFKSKVFIYYGRQNWEPVLYETDADVAIESPAGMLYFGYFIQVIGDYNDDGYNDFVVSGMNYPVNDTTYKMESYLYLGGATINTTPITLSFGESKTIQYFGYRISKLGDVNDDGYDDFALSDRNFAEGSKRGRVLVFFGGKSVNPANNLQITCPNSLINRFGTLLANSPGDFDSDGINDIAIGCSIDRSINAGRIFIYKGGKNIDTSSYYTVDLNDIKNIGDTTAAMVYGAVDFAFQFSEADKYDLIVSTGYDLSNNAYIYKCGSPENKTQADFILEGPNKICDLGGFYKFAVGNFNKDSRLDIVMCQQNDCNLGGEPGFGAGMAYFFESPFPVIQTDIEEENQMNPLNDNVINYPNPFSSTEKIRFYLNQHSSVQISIYDIFGKIMREMPDKYYENGWNEISWDGCGDFGNELPSGEYFCKLRAGGKAIIQKIVLVR